MESELTQSRSRQRSLPRWLGNAFAGSILIAMLVLKPVSRAVRYLGYVGLSVTFLLELLGIPNFPFLTMLSIGLVLVGAAVVYDAVCSALEFRLRVDR